MYDVCTDGAADLETRSEAAPKSKSGEYKGWETGHHRGRYNSSELYFPLCYVLTLEHGRKGNTIRKEPQTYGKQYMDR